MSNDLHFYRMHPQGVLISVWAKPGAAQNRRPKMMDRGNGNAALEIAVGAPPEDGKANKAIGENLAKFLGVKKKTVSLQTGQTSREKTFLVEGDQEELLQKLKEKLD